MAKSKTTSTLALVTAAETVHQVTGKLNPAALVPALTDDSQDVQMGTQLTAQYQRAVGGMREVLIFGAMMMMLREQHPELTQKGPAAKSKPARGLTPEDQPISLQKWLEKYAPEVKRQTAQRFLAVTEAISERYEEVVGKAIAKQFSLAALVTTPAADLPGNAAAKQLELFDFVNGTSQRSWLDRFLPDSPQKRGAANRQTQEPAKPKTEKELKEEAEAELENILTYLDGWFLAAHHTRVSKEKRTIADAALEKATQLIRGVK